MPLATRCPECNVNLRLSERAVGSRVRCPKCQRVFQVSSVNFEVGAADSAKETISSDTARPVNAATARGSHADEQGPYTENLTGKEIGRFVVRQVLGQGNYGTVYRAFDPALDRDVALKVPK